MKQIKRVPQKLINHNNKMDIIKYRKWYLSEKWADNQFQMITRSVIQHKRFRDGARKPHPLVSSGEGFWINTHVLCIGYQLNSNPDIFRPIFSHRRQCLLDGVHLSIKYPSAFWRRVKQRYYLSMARVSKIPLECVIHIVHFIV